MGIYFFLIRIAALFGHKKAKLLVEGQRGVWERIRMMMTRRMVLTPLTL